MIDRQRLNDELRRLRELIRSDPRVLARIDGDGDGTINGEEWERARRAIIERLKKDTESAVVSCAQATGGLAQEVYEQELCAVPRPPEVPRMVTCDHLILEWLVDYTLPRKSRPLGPQWEYTIRSGDRVQLGEFERLATLTDADLRFRSTWKENEMYYSIRPDGGERYCIRRYPTALGEALDVCSVYGRTIASVSPRVRFLKYAYRIEDEDGRHLMAVPRAWDKRCERAYKRTGGKPKRARSRRASNPYHLVNDEGKWLGYIDSELYVPDPKKRKTFYRQWVIRLEPDCLTLPLRWGLIGSLAFLLRGPFLFRGWLWSILRTNRR